jgi:MFS superfamily sulfate permease-like transporter
MSTVTLPNTRPNNWSYDRMMRLFGGMWFMLLALCVATKIGASLTDPWPSLLSSFCISIFYMLLAVFIITRSPAKAHADGLLPRIAAFVGTYLPWTITFFGKTDQALPNLLSTACMLIGMIMMLVTIRHLGRLFSLVPQPGQWCKPVLIDGLSTHFTSRKRSRYSVYCCNT